MTGRRMWYERLYEKINKLSARKVATLFLVIGLLTFATGLGGEFQGDDNQQILNNPPVQEGRISELFAGGTFWDGGHLAGSFYRPLMSVTFSIIYNVFGANPGAFHVVQLLIYSAGCFVLYLFMRSIFKPAVALMLSILFFVHPANSQVVFSIQNMQEPLLFVFGIGALYVISRSQTLRSLATGAVLLFCSLLSKETGVVFVLISVAYIAIYHKHRMGTYLKVLLAPIALYVLMRTRALGAIHEAITVSPVSGLDLSARLLMIPSLIVFYLGLLVWPAQLAMVRYWTIESPDFIGFWLPLTVVVLVTVLVGIGFRYLRRRSVSATNTYMFFAIWTVLGFGLHMQIVPLDMTASESWLFVPMVGILGMLAAFSAIRTSGRSAIKWGYLLVVPIAIVFMVRSEVRGLDFRSQYTLSMQDITVEPDNYLALNNIAKYLIGENRLDEAREYALRSVAAFPSVSAYTNLGVIEQRSGRWDAAKDLYQKGLEYGTLGAAYENLAIVYVAGKDADAAIAYVQRALLIYPKNAKLWNYLAILQAEKGDKQAALEALSEASKTGATATELYKALINDSHLEIQIPGTNRLVIIN